MTTVSGHNLVIQQSGLAQEITHQTAAPKPAPEQTAALQAASDVLKNSTVREFEESEKLEMKKEKETLKIRQKKEEKRKRKRQEELDLDPDAKGKLLDTMI
jgi:hypothetical protein